MTLVRTAAEVFEGIQRVKADAKAYCTNFFPVQTKLEKWVAHQELFTETHGRVAFFTRKDRDFAHLYFCAAEAEAFGRGLPGFAASVTGRLTIDLVGPEASLVNLIEFAERAGFQRYSRLVRLVRLGASTPAALRNSGLIILATEADAPAILRLIEHSFNRFADQLPTLYEIEGAIAAHQILVVKEHADVAALLFFETQGVTSTIRYWVVAAQYQSRGFGSALIRHYFSSCGSAVRRFTLWVTASNDNAMQKYQHYGYAPDGLVDHVLVTAPANS